MKKEILQYAQRLYRDKLVTGTSGNISIFDSENNCVVITPSSKEYMKITEDNIIIMDFDGNVIEGIGKPSSEWRMHVEIYRNRRDIKAVVHTHSPYATGFAVLNESIPIILIEMVPWLNGEIQVAEFALPGTVEMGATALKVLTDKYACLLSNHGVLAVGESIQKAYNRVAYVEDAAKIYFISKAIGEPKLLPESAVRHMMSKLGR